VARAFLGVGLQELTPQIADHLGLDTGAGVLVASVRRNSPAAQCGLRPGDLVVAWNDVAVDDANALSRLIAATKIGSTAQLKLLRDAQSLTVDVVVAERPAQL
jgi:S1-C subfamily serine protease